MVLSNSYKGKIFKFSIFFNTKESDFPKELTYEEIEKSSKNQWEDFWTSGGIIDFSESKDNRAFELERRIILSRYLTRAAMYRYLSTSRNRINL